MDKRRELAAALANLTLPADQQEAYLRRLGTAPSADELALELDDALIAIPTAPQAHRYLRELSNLLRSMSGSANAVLWDVAALHRAPEWVKVRRLAALAITELTASGAIPGD